MSKLSLINREAKRRATVKKYAARRQVVQDILRDPQAPDEEKTRARLEMQSMPKNASKTRLHNRCAMTGRPRGFYRKFGLGRNKLRELVMRGEVPGMVKASW